MIKLVPILVTYKTKSKKLLLLLKLKINQRRDEFLQKKMLIIETPAKE